MSGWFSGLFGKRNQDNGADAVEQTSAAPNTPQSDLDIPHYEDPDDAPVSPLAMMSEKSPEAWLGQFLTILGAPPALQFSTLRAAKDDTRLAAHLQNVLETAAKDQPMRLLEPGATERLKAQDWAAWWRTSESLGRYCYAVLSLAMLGDRTHNADIATMYTQDSNSRIHKDAHYVISYILGKDWPAYRVTDSDLARLAQG